MNYHQHVATESDLGVLMISMIIAIESDLEPPCWKRVFGKPFNPEDKRMRHRTHLSSTTSGLSCITPAEQGVLELQLNLGQCSFDRA